MNDNITHLPMPAHPRSVAEALACVNKVDCSHVLILSAMPDGSYLMVNGANNGEPLTAAEIVWLLERAKMIVMGTSTEWKQQ